ncbi:beta-ketoacyl synthase [Lentzea tibetensis]|uniref:Beta-ketoacyl synthase n=1 Tax=Lentzea tibetensis TaxID=2591470 RepID=A0A563ESZ6_9PSEU|nr:beta-ketoacyl synthase N-terminal-like domain-containing protein [Lentzea tibetensis]TWP50621.1 beta-ketoacyl synthase [Lentzea tibetensis]
MRFEPIAIVGRGAVLPDARDADTFCANVIAGRMSISTAPEGRWKVPHGVPEGTWGDVGGYVRHFAAEQGLDPQFQWVRHGVEAALEGLDRGRAGLVLGNLSFPTVGMADYAERVWRGNERTDPRNRFMSGLPAHLTGLDAFALDAACASSLYAIKLACDRLHDRTADVMVAGAVNCADDLFIHVGFSALSALSKSGRSRPFHREADGLVPAEGAAFVSLMRLADVRDEEVFGVIRGVGLSNDGRGSGMLVPSAEGQIRAMRQAYQMAGVAPETVELLECHATGTPVGDVVEVTSAAQIFKNHKGLAIGSAKSNVGHLITAAGVAGLIKVLGAMRNGVRPATLNADDTIDALDGTPLRVLTEAEEWIKPKRAAVSAFGFGGNNAHLIVDAPGQHHGAVEPLPLKEPVAIVAIGAKVGTGDSTHDLTRALFTGEKTGKRESVDVALQGLRMPPLDLAQTHAQQLLVLETAREVARNLPRDRTMVLIGMGCDAEVARYGARWRAAPEERDGVVPNLTSAAVVGTMPNITANRINAVLDLAGPSFSVSAEEASGVVALELAARAIRHGEADAAVVGAVDLSHEPVHEQALADLGITRESGDAAVVLVLKKFSDAQDDEIIALLDDATSEADLIVGDRGFDPSIVCGTPHAAKGLLAVATAALALRHRATPRTGAPADPAFDVDTAKVVVKPLEAGEKTVRLRQHRTKPWIAERPPRLRVYSGADRTAVIDALDAGRESGEGPARLVLLDDDKAPAKAWLEGRALKPEGAAFRATPLAGEIGFVFTGGLAAYPGMGRELLLAFPHLLEQIEARSGSVRDVVGWAFEGADSEPREVLDQIWGTALLSQVHAMITRDLLGITPNAALGYSAGESNALVALGVWTDMRKLRAEMTSSGMFSRQVAGEFMAIKRAWARQGVEGTRWKNYLVGVSADHARKRLHGEQAVHLIAVNSPDSCIIGGEVTACERVLSTLDAAYTLPVPYELAVHTPELGEVRNEWWRLHCRPTTPPPGVRFYSCATDDSYLPTAERVADALTAQAVGTMDFAGAIEQAWRDGVRIFVEHGPKSLCSDWIRRTLGDREHLAVALDAQDGRSVRQLSRVAAELVAAGVDVNTTALHDQLDSAVPGTAAQRSVLTLPAHPPEVRLSKTTMVRPPVLPPVTTPVPRPSLPDAVAAPGLPRDDSKPGPKFTREQLEHLAGGKISELFGFMFEAQDGYARQCRMPQPPMLLADRVTGIDAEPGSMGTGTIWTETDVLPDAWYLDSTGRMPPGILIESGQADLLLISWLGADLLNKGERVYRLLGCELTFHGSPPEPGETLRYQIEIDGHAELNGIRLFFFHYDCYVGDELRLSVRKGQAGFFTDQELAATTGVIWDPELERPEGPCEAPVVVTGQRSFDAEQVRAFADGRPYDCFGPQWDLTRAHIRTPRIDDGRMLFLDEVTDFDVKGGPWQRGYLKAETKVEPDEWFFDGHFKNDPCMPGTLMFQGCLQAMSFYLAGCGFTIGNDAWRFEPVPGEGYDMRCRGQVTPDSRNLSYEVFVSELVAGPIPTLHADVLCTVDGVKAFHAKRVGLRLVPAWPLDQWRTRELANHVETGAVAEAGGVRFDYAALLACAWGKPSDAFGELYARFDSHRKVARLPGAPYHFMSRIASVDGAIGGMEAGSSCVVEYDVPADAWYFEQNGQATMPLAVLMEVVLQPCGWLASYVGCAVEIDKDLLFRNLDGKGTIHGEITPDTKVVRTTTKLRDISVNGPMIIVSFDVRCYGDDALVYELDTVFGFFPPESFVDQPGLGCTDAERAALAPSGQVVDLTARPAKYCDGELRLAGPMLLMLDRVTGYDPTGGAAGLGRLTAEKDVDAGEWFFKAHFFQDPVQPGSLGIEALYQLLQFYLLERGAGEGLAQPRFEMMMDSAPMVWKYRGQVVPSHTTISSELEITSYDAENRCAKAKAWLWVDGRRIYSTAEIGVRVVGASQEENWLHDHRPTWTVPVVPMMSVVDQLAGGETALRDVTLRRWIPAAEPPRMKVERDGSLVTLLVWRDAQNPVLSRFEPVATAKVVPRGARPAPFAELPNAEPVTDFYTSGALFHGPAFHYLKSLRRSAGGASGVLDAGAGSVPRGNLHQGLLDAATHAIPHDSMWRWYQEIPRDQVAYPHRITSFEQYEPLPSSGEVQVEARFAGFENGDRRFPVVQLQLLSDGQVLVAMRLVEVLMPTGVFGAASSAQRRAFLRDRVYADGLGLSTTEVGTTRLSLADVEQCDWLVGTVASAYGLPAGARGRDHLARIAVQDHVARLLRVHPSAVRVEGHTAQVAGETYDVLVTEHESVVFVRG